MSKAFTREDQTPDELLPEPPAPVLPPGAKNYITQAGARRLHQDLERLRQEVAQSRGVQTPEGQQKVREVERRIHHLTRQLQTVEVAEPPLCPDRVVFGTTVTLRDEQERTRRYRIVGIDEADARQGAVSWLSPIAQALLNARVGDLVTLRTPRSEEELEVIGIGD